MTGWTWELSQFIADVADWYPGHELGLVLTLLILATAIAVLSQGMKRLRRKTGEYADLVAEYETDELGGSEELPDLPADLLRARARAFMAAGDDRAAVREWLRATIRDLIDREFVDHRPGWTVTELARAATAALPGISDWMDEEARVFSDLWYGGVEAGAGHSRRMEELDGLIAAAASGRLTGSGS